MITLLIPSESAAALEDCKDGESGDFIVVGKLTRLPDGQILVSGESVTKKGYKAKEGKSEEKAERGHKMSASAAAAIGKKY